MYNNLTLHATMLTSLFQLATLPVTAKASPANTSIQIINAKIDDDGNLAIAPSKTSSANDFDFFVGEWTVINKKLKTRLNNSKDWTTFNATQSFAKILHGIGNIDHFYAKINGADFEGMTLRLFDPKTRLWSIYWADSNNGKLEVPVVGSFENHIGRFYAKDTLNGKPILVMFNWDATNPDKPVWSQAFSADNGKTWEWNWYMYFEKVK